AASTSPAGCRRPGGHRPQPAEQRPPPDGRVPSPTMSVTTRNLSPSPHVERVRPGLWSIPVPLPNNSLRYVLVYVFETDAGPYLVDAGWNTDDAYAALDSGLKVAGFSMADVQGVLVTHMHPDHYGLAGRVRDVS